jgi:hypothetical protein
MNVSFSRGVMGFELTVSQTETELIDKIRSKLKIVDEWFDDTCVTFRIGTSNRSVKDQLSFILECQL